MNTDIRSMNKAVLVQKKLGTKTIVFVVPTPNTGPTKFDIRFNHSGKVVDIFASAKTPSTEPTNITIEKCSDYDNQVWETVGNLTLAANDRTSDSFTLISDRLQKYDYVRVNFTDLGLGLSGVTVEVIVEVQ